MLYGTRAIIQMSIKDKDIE